MTEPGQLNPTVQMILGGMGVLLGQFFLTIWNNRKTVKTGENVIAQTATPEQLQAAKVELRREQTLLQLQVEAFKKATEAKLNSLAEELSKVKTTGIVTRQLTEKTLKAVEHPNSPNIEVPEETKTEIRAPEPDHGKVELQEIPQQPLGKTIWKKD